MTYIVNSRFSVIPFDDFNYSFAQLTLLKQMALGVPILAADVPAIREYANESSGVKSYIPYNADSLSENLQYMSEISSDKLGQMGQDNIAAVKSTLSEQDMAKKIETICDFWVDQREEKRS